MTTEERAAKKELKKQRIEKLAEINRWEKQRCEICSVASANAAIVNCKCKAATSIRRLGKEIGALAIKARKKHRADLIKKSRKQWNIDLYLQMRHIEMSDAEIAEGLGVRKDIFRKWKVANGIHRGQLNQRPEVETELDRGNK